VSCVTCSLIGTAWRSTTAPQQLNPGRSPCCGHGASRRPAEPTGSPHSGTGSPQSLAKVRTGAVLSGGDCGAAEDDLVVRRLGALGKFLDRIERIMSLNE
jgi:hypothetical protein